MALKILLLVILAMAMGHGSAESCNKRDLYKLSLKTKCKPQEQPIQLPVPVGFDYLVPSVVKTKRCTGLDCSHLSHKMKCFPAPGAITNQTYKVNGHHSEHKEPQCLEVAVVEHRGCECRCENTDCPFNNMIFDDIACDCKCDPAKEEECNDLRNKDDGPAIQWVESTCSCQCDSRPECDTRMVWVNEVCRCVDFDELDQFYQRQ